MLNTIAILKVNYKICAEVYSQVRFFEHINLKNMHKNSRSNTVISKTNKRIWRKIEAQNH